MKTCFSEGKLIKQFGNTPLSKRTTPLSTNPPISDQFFHDPPFCPNFKNKNPPPSALISGGEETMILPLSKTANQMWRDYSFSQRNKTTERTVREGV